jgi:hypothetical protein
MTGSGATDSKGVPPELRLKPPRFSCFPWAVHPGEVTAHEIHGNRGPERTVQSPGRGGPEREANAWDFWFFAVFDGSCESRRGMVSEMRFFEVSGLGLNWKVAECALDRERRVVGCGSGRPSICGRQSVTV